MAKARYTRTDGKTIIIDETEAEASIPSLKAAGYRRTETVSDAAPQARDPEPAPIEDDEDDDI